MSIIALMMVTLSLMVCVAAANVISISDGQVTATGSTATISLEYDAAPAGLSGYSINVNVSDPSVATITGVTFPAWATMKENTSLPAGSVNLKAADLNEQVQSGATAIPLATLTLSGKAAGSTSVTATVVRMNDDTDARIYPEVEAGTFTITVAPSRTEPIFADHTNATLPKLSQVPQSAIEQAKSNLHIAYGHTSHGSQVTDGMTGLTTFAGAPYGGSLYQWNDGGTGGALDLDDYFVEGDLGNPDYTTWASRTRTYLNANPDVNVVMWSWCGQADTSAENINTYLTLMNQLEQDYPDVDFVYMTGHLAGTGSSGNLNQRNEQIRAYCRANNKILYDFADIESYDPDGNGYLDLGADDACNYNGGNWATAWQNIHTVGTDWYQCGAAHTEPLNANMKAYAAWWLWARLGGWDGGGSTPPNPTPILTSIAPDTAEAGGASFTLTVQGSNFVQGSSVRWNGNSRTTTYISPTTLTASIPSSDIAGEGSAEVTVFNPAPGGGPSTPATFTISGTAEEKSNLSVTSTPPGAAIAIDNHATNETTPVTFTGVPAGSHTVTASLSGYTSQTKTVNVEQGTTAHADFQLEQSAGHTVPNVSGHAEGAVILLSWDVIQDADLSGYKVVVSKNNPNPKYPDDGYMFWITDRNHNYATLDNTTHYNGGDFGGYLQPGQKYYISVTALYNDGSRVPGNVLELVFPPVTTPEKGSIAVTSEPPGANVTVNGYDTHQVTPVTFTNVSAGTYTVAVQLNGYAPASMDVIVSPGETATAAFTLTAVSHQADLVITKELSAVHANIGESVTWTVNVTNTGPDTATSIVVGDDYTGMPGVVIVGVNPPDTGTITGLQWNIPSLENGQSTRFSVITSFTSAGNKTNIASIVSSGTTDPDPSDNSASASVIIDTPQVQSPVAGFTASPSSGTAPLMVQFNDTSTGTDISGWLWDFDNDGVIDSNTQNPAYTYNIPGTYSVSLTVSNPGGSDTKLLTNGIVVTGAPQTESGLLVTPVSSTISPGGTRQVQVIARNMSSGLSGGNISVTLSNPGVAVITAVTPPAWAVLNKTSSVPGASAWIDLVDIGQSIQPGATDVLLGTFTIEGTAPGESDIVLAVIELDSENGSALSPELAGGHLTVTSLVKANFTANPLSGNAPLSVQFTDESTGTDIMSWAWDFDNDGKIDSVDRNPAHTYTTAGTYSVNLTVRNSGSRDTMVKTGYITVTEAPVAPVANFTADATTGIVPFLVNFTDTSTGTDITSWAWDFNGDGAIDSNVRNPSHTYDHPGRYTVNLTVTNTVGSDTISRAHYIVANRYVEPFPGYTKVPTDPDGDGLYEDINGNGRLDFDDVVAFYLNMQWVRNNSAVGIAPYDFNQNGRIDYDDVVQLYLEVLNS